jgi:hypothetical protein
VRGLGCGHRIAPVLERLDKIDGVTASSANYTGTLIRISVAAAANREGIADEVRKELSADDREPTRLQGDRLTEALRKEEWRGIGQIGELSAIEFRTLALARVRAFAEGEGLAEGVADKLLRLAEAEWDRLARSAEAKGTAQPPHKTDWVGRCSQFALAFFEQAKELLTADQLERLKQRLPSQARGRLSPE